MNCRLTGFSLQDMLLLAGLTGKTGELVLESGNNIGSILFHEGRILQAFSPYSRAIGDLLVEKGIIAEGELLETLQQQKKNHESPLGSLLIKAGKVSFAAIESMVHEQIRQAVRDFAVWPDLSFSFIDKTFIPFDMIHLPVHEFIPPDTIRSVIVFCSFQKNAQSPAATPTSLRS